MGDTTTRRLGRIETAILAELQRAGGLLQRDAAVVAVFPTPPSSSENGHRTEGVMLARRRASAESAMSRAIVSLERKGLVVREVNPTTRRVMIRLHDCVALPYWEAIARAEEDMGAHCRKQAAAWGAVARRLCSRAAAIRRVQSADETEADRQADLEAIERLEGGCAPTTLG